MSLAIEIATNHGIVKVDLDLIKRSESRLMEIASASPSQALELIAFFTDSLSKLVDNIFDVQLALSRAEVDTECRRSIIFLDKSEDGSKKGSNADVRKAMVYTDPEFLALKEKENQLEATLAFLKEKKEVLAKGYFGAKDIIAVNGSLNLGGRINA